MFFEQMHPRWQAYLADQKPLLEQLESRVANLQDLQPDVDFVMRAFVRDPILTKVVLLGQDPYPNPGDANGLAFAVNPSQPRPRSLINIFKELSSDLGEQISPSADLSEWSHRGVLLLNTSLTTLAHKPAAHAGIGWEEFTSRALYVLSHFQKIVIMAWGNHAKNLASLIPDTVVVESAHPSPLSASRGFFGSRPFSRANQELIKLGLEPIDWKL